MINEKSDLFVLMYVVAFEFSFPVIYFSDRLIASILTSEMGTVHLGLDVSTRYSSYLLLLSLPFFCVVLWPV